MRKITLMMVAVVMAAAVYAQDTKKVFGSTTMVWYGIDFTKAKMVGFGDESPMKIKTEYFKPWNEVTVDLDLAKVFQKNAVYKDPNGVIKENLARETSDLKADDAPALTAEAIAERVKQLPQGSKKDGLGIVFIVEGFNKTDGNAIVHVAFFDIASREVLWLKKMTGKAASGASLKAWTAALKDIFSQIEKKEYKAWKVEANY